MTREDAANAVAAQRLEPGEFWAGGSRYSRRVDATPDGDGFQCVAHIRVNVDTNESVPSTATFTVVPHPAGGVTVTRC